MEKEYKDIIYKWVAKNFGESEADDPIQDVCVGCWHKLLKKGD